VGGGKEGKEGVGGQSDERGSPGDERGGGRGAFVEKTGERGSKKLNRPKKKSKMGREDPRRRLGRTKDGVVRGGGGALGDLNGGREETIFSGTDGKRNTIEVDRGVADIWGHGFGGE